MRRKRHIPANHPAFADLPVQLITVGDGASQIAVHVAGPLSSQTTPLICVPGYHRNMSDFTQFSSRVQQLTGGSSPIVLLDLQGRGRSSDRPEPQDYGSPGDARDIIAVANALGITTAIFVGQGYGGQVTMAVAAERPNLIAGTILLDAGPVTDSRGIVRLRNNMGHLASLRGAKVVTAGFRKVLQGDYPGANEAQIADLMLRTHYLDKRGQAKPLYDARLMAALDAFSYDDILMAQWPLFDGLAAIPLLLLRTQLTDQVRRDTFEEMTRRRPDASAWTIQGQGSPALFDQTEEIHAVADFVGSITQRRKR